MGYNPVSDRIILARFKTMIGILIVIQIYAPTTDAKQQEIDSFYNLLQATLNDHKHSASVIVMGDFNAKVGNDWKNAGGALGRFGRGDSNETGECLIQFANANSMVITNTCFRQAKANRQWTWESPDGVTLNVIDYILISSRWKSSVTNSRAYPSADIGSDHQLLIANIRLKLKVRRRHKASNRYDTKKLNDPLVAIEYQAEVAEKLTPIIDMLTGDTESGINDTAERLVDAFNSTSQNVLGNVRSLPAKEWLSEDTWKLIQERRTLKPSRRENIDNQRHYNYLCREIKRRSQCDKDTYLRKIVRV